MIRWLPESTSNSRERIKSRYKNVLMERYDRLFTASLPIPSPSPFFFFLPSFRDFLAMRGDLMGRKKEEGSRYIRRCLSYVESMMLSHRVRVPPSFLPFFFFSSPHFFSHFFFYSSPFFPPSSLDPLINAGVKLLFISDRDLGNGGAPPIDRGEKIVTRSGDRS